MSVFANVLASNPDIGVKGRILWAIKYFGTDADVCMELFACSVLFIPVFYKWFGRIDAVHWEILLLKFYAHIAKKIMKLNLSTVK